MSSGFVRRTRHGAARKNDRLVRGGGGCGKDDSKARRPETRTGDQIVWGDSSRKVKGSEAVVWRSRRRVSTFDS